MFECCIRRTAARPSLPSIFTYSNFDIFRLNYITIYATRLLFCYFVWIYPIRIYLQFTERRTKCFSFLYVDVRQSESWRICDTARHGAFTFSTFALTKCDFIKFYCSTGSHAWKHHHHTKWWWSSFFFFFFCSHRITSNFLIWGDWHTVCNLHSAYICIYVDVELWMCMVPTFIKIDNVFLWCSFFLLLVFLLLLLSFVLRATSHEIDFYFRHSCVCVCVGWSDVRV